MGRSTHLTVTWMAALVALALAACATPGRMPEPPTERAVRFTIGGDHVPGTLYLAQGRGPHPTLVWFHGFPGLPGPAPEAVASLRDAGLNVVYVHYRGSWGTPGTFGPSSALDDAAAVLSGVRAAPESWRSDPAHVIAMGDSFGSWVALQAAAADDGVACVAGALVLDLGRTGRDLAASEDMRAAFGGMFAQVAQDGSLGFALAGGAAGLMASIIDGQARNDLHALAQRLSGRPVLLIGAADDELAPVDAHLLPVAEALSAAGADVTRHVLPGDHGIPDSTYAGLVADWVRDECLRTRPDLRQGAARSRHP